VVARRRRIVRAGMTIRFLIAHAYSIGGTIRTTFQTAGKLAEDHEVEVVSVYRLRNEPGLELDPRVRLRVLTDLRPASVRRVVGPAVGRSSRLIHPDDSRYPMFNLLTDAALLRFLKSTRDGVLVGTRPGLNLAIAGHARAGVIRIGQDHMNLDYPPGLLRAFVERYPRLDAVNALTEETAAGYRELLGPGARVFCIPNAAPPTPGKRAALDAPLVVAAGGLTRRKGFDRLLEAWARLAPDHPQWRLRIFGDGPYRGDLDRLIDELGIRRSARLCGHSPRLLEELAGASVFAMTSRKEGFPMVILEAMSVGLPVVAYDCPTGPRDMVSDGVDGHVVPDGRTRLFTEALGGLMRDADRRRRFGAAAQAKVKQYRIDAIADRWDACFRELAAAKNGRPTGSLRGGATIRARA
jgi:glycosyltransferase involved in cell wall biosynthesis